MRNIIQLTTAKEVLNHSTFNIQHSIFNPRQRRGFTLLEILIVMAIMVILAGSGVGFYRNFVENVELQSATKSLASDLRQMRSNAMIGVGGFNWGAHLVNNSMSPDYYELFSTPTDYGNASKEVISTTTLSLGVGFIDNPADGLSINVIFSKISGTSTEQTIGLVSEGATSTISVTSIGTIN